MMNDIIFKGLPLEDRIEIFGQNELVLNRTLYEKAILLMTRVYDHKFMVKLPHNLLLSQNKKTLLSKEQNDKVLYEHFMKKMDLVKSMLVDCSLSELPEKQDLIEGEEEDEEDPASNSFLSLIVRERF